MVLETGLLSKNDSLKCLSNSGGLCIEPDYVGVDSQEGTVWGSVGNKSTTQQPEQIGTCKPTTEAEAAEPTIEAEAAETYNPTAVETVPTIGHDTPPCNASMPRAWEMPGQSTPSTTNSTPIVTPSSRGEPTPTPREAAWCLTKFTNEVQRKRPTPLIGSPSKQKPLAKKVTIPIRS